MSIITVRPTASACAEQVLLELVAEEHHAPAAVDVEVVDVAPAGRRGSGCASAAKIGLSGRDLPGVIRTRSRRNELLSRAILAGEAGLGDLAPQRRRGPPPRRGCDVPCRAPRRAARCAPARRSRCSRPVRAGSSPIRLCRPSPNATSSATDTVPQVMPKKVRSVRIFWWRSPAASAGGRKRFMASPVLHDVVAADRYSIFFGGRSTTTSFCLSPSRHLDVHAVGEPDLDLLLDRRRPLASGPGTSTHALPSAKVTSALGQHQHVVLLAHRDLGVRRVARAQRHVLAGQQLDLDVEQRGAFDGPRSSGRSSRSSFDLGARAARRP